MFQTLGNNRHQSSLIVADCGLLWVIECVLVLFSLSYCAHCGSLWVIVVNCGSLWLIVAHCGSLWLIVAHHCGSLWLIMASLWFIVVH